jgi:hypothetical protein
VPPADRDAAGTGAPARRVHRADRVRDWIALGLVIAGALLYGAAHRGMGSVARDRTPTTDEAAARGEWKMVRWNRFERMSRAGMVLVAAGAAVSIWSFARHAARRRGAEHAA